MKEHSDDWFGSYATYQKHVKCFNEDMKSIGSEYETLYHNLLYLEHSVYSQYWTKEEIQRWHDKNDYSKKVERQLKNTDKIADNQCDSNKNCLKNKSEGENITSISELPCISHDLVLNNDKIVDEVNKEEIINGIETQIKKEDSVCEKENNSNCVNIEKITNYAEIEYKCNEVIIEPGKNTMITDECTYEPKDGYRYKFITTKVNDSLEIMYKCAEPGCRKIYTTLAGLDYHKKIGCKLENENLKNYVCTFYLCGKRFKTRNGLDYHKKHGHVYKVEK